MHRDHRKINTRENRIYDAINKHKYHSSLCSSLRKVKKEVRMFVVQRRDSKTLLPIIIRHYLPGTEIISDEWRSYRRIRKLGLKYKHYTVNHSKNFVDPDTKKHIQLIECLWLKAKATIMKRGKGTVSSNLPGHLAEQWFQSRLEHDDIFVEIMKVLGKY